MGYFAFLGYLVVLGFWLHSVLLVAFCAFGCKMKTLRIRQSTVPAAGGFGKEDRPGDE
jgi:hypothetical protein